jgi:hypothetical protein
VQAIRLTQHFAQASVALLDLAHKLLHEIANLGGQCREVGLGG